MTKKEWEQRAWQNKALASLGIPEEEAEALRRISNKLRRWFEKECGDDYGCIEREGENGDGRPFWRWENGDKGSYLPDREAGARKRLAAIMAKYPDLVPYIQGDPRGASLYILRKDQIKAGEDIDGIYSRGICVY